jgi:chromate transporter
MPDETDTIDSIGTKRRQSTWRWLLAHEQTEAQGKNKVTLWSLLYLWSKIGIQSLGGGSSTLFLIRREFIERRQWLTEEEYTRYWSLSQVSPGIILVAVVILMGRHLAGIRGIVVSLAGLLVPSALITVLLTAGFVLIENLHPIQAMIQGVVPATAGVMLTISLQFAQPPLRQSFKEGFLQFTECVVIIVGSALALILFHSDVILVLLAAGLLSLGVFLPLHRWLSGKQGERG